MPLTEFQQEVLLLLKAHRNPNSYVAGGIAIHDKPNSSRSSNDIDFFHDTEEAVISSFDADVETMRSQKFEIEILLKQPSFIRAVVSKDQETLKLEWVRDTAFRFFPVIEDPQLGYRLHDVDLAVNKCLALANRNEVRDIIDLIQLHSSVISVAQASFAACGKDPGFNPELILDCMKRNSIIDPHKLAAESLVKEISPTELKREWLKILENTQKSLARLPAADLGCIYLQNSGEVLR